MLHFPWGNPITSYWKLNICIILNQLARGHFARILAVAFGRFAEACVGGLSKF